jgi:hypothetical protein
MKIVSKKKDYYDGVQRFDEDRSLVFVRHEETEWYGEKKWYGDPDTKLLPPPGPVFHNASLPRFNRTSVGLQVFYVGFCGLIYPGLRCHVGSEIIYRQDFAPSEKTFYCYSSEHFDHFLQQNVTKDEWKWYDSSPAKKGRYSSTRKPREDVDQFFAEYFTTESARKQYDPWFRVKNSPIFVVQPNGWGQHGSDVQRPARAVQLPAGVRHEPRVSGTHRCGWAIRPSRARPFLNCPILT